MAKHQLFYENINNEFVPYWYVISFKKFEIDWDKHVYYTDILPPFIYSNRDFFNTRKVSCTIRLADLVFSDTSVNHIGLNLKIIKNKILKSHFDAEMVNQFIIALPDLDEFLKLIPRKKRFFLMKR